MDWPLLDTVPEEHRRAVLSGARRRRFAAGEVLVHAGDPADCLHLVESGRLTVQVATYDGDTAILNVLGPGDYFGEISLLHGPTPKRTATVTALDATETLTISAPIFAALREDYPGLDEFVLRLLAHRVDALSASLLAAMYDTLDRRVYRRLLQLLEIYQAPDKQPITIPLTQDVLSELVGARRPSVNQVLQKLSAQGIISLSRGRIVVHDAAALEAKIR